MTKIAFLVLCSFFVGKVDCFCFIPTVDVRQQVAEGTFFPIRWKTLGRKKGQGHKDGHATTSTSLSVVFDPALLGVAITAAAAGALAQSPRIAGLEQQLKESEESAAIAQQNMTDKVFEIEQQLFEIDQEYEEQTENFRQMYEKKMQDELEIRTKKIKADYDQSLDIQSQLLKQALLLERLDDVHGMAGRKFELDRVTAEKNRLEEVNMRLQEMNQQLEESLQATKKDLEALREEANKKRFPFF